MNYSLLIPNSDKRSPNQVALNIFSSLDIGNKKIFYTNNYIEDINSEINYKIKKISIKDCLSILRSGSIVHSHGLVPDFVSFILKLIDFKKKSKYISTVHSLLKSDLYESKGWSGLVYYFFWKKLLFRMDSIIVLNSISKETIEKELGPAFQGEIYVIPNSYKLSHFDKSPDLYTKIINDKKASGKTIIATASVLREMKGLQHIIDVLVDNKNFFYVMIGAGPYESELIERANAKGVTEQMLILGYQNNPLKYLDTVDVFILSSQFEGFPMALLEAVSLGIPCVVNDIPLFREFYPSNAVKFCDVTSANELANNIVAANNNLDQAKIALDYTKKHYSHSAISALYENIFSSYRME